MSVLSCNIEVWNGLSNMIRKEDSVDVELIAKDMIPKFRKDAMLFAGKHGCKENVLYFIKQWDEELDILRCVSFFKDTFISNDEIRELIRKYPDAEFGIIYADHNKYDCERLWAEEKSKHIAPITLKAANAFVTTNHRHHDSVTGCKFAIGLYKTVDGEDILIGTAICGRPVSRYLDDGLTLEINRLCVTEDGNCCSMLYGTCSRIAKEMGYKKAITYILESEPGISLKASNFILDKESCGGENWTGKRKRENNTVPEEMKQRWVKILAA